MAALANIATLTSVIAEAAEYVGSHEAMEHADGATPIAAALISAGARVEAMVAVVELVREMLDNGVLRITWPEYRNAFSSALRRAETPPNTRAHYEAMALAAAAGADA